MDPKTNQNSDQKKADSRAFHFLMGRIWSYRLQGLVIVFLGVFVSLTQVASFSMVKPLLDIIFEDQAESVIQGISLLSDVQKSQIVNFIETNVYTDNDSRMKWLKIFIGIFLLIAVTNLILNAIHRMFSRYIAQHFQVELYKELYHHMLTFPVRDIYSRKQGDIASRYANDTRMMQESVHEFFQIIVKEPFTVTFTLGTCFIMNWRVTLFAMTIFPIVGVIIALISKRVRKLAVRESKSAGNLLHQVSESVGGIHIIKTFQSEKFLGAKLNEQCKHYLATIRKIIKIEAMTSPILEFLGQLAIVLVLLALAPAVFAEKVTPGDVIGILVLLVTAYKPIKSMSNAIQKMSRSLGATDRYVDLIHSKPEVDQGIKIFPEKINEIEFKDVHFAYEDEKVLNGVSLKIQEGETVAIVGATGAGKSTIMQLIPRFYDTKEGEILLSGGSIKDYSLAELRKHIAFVSQSVFLFNDTVKNNVTMGQEYTQEEIEAACKAAHAHEFITKLDHGYDTESGDRGVKLSGGQCQRISLARAFLKNPPILLLDEATSALDSETEKNVQESIENLSKNRTTIVIAHRLTTIQRADKIVVMDKGKVIEQGVHKELLAKQGMYAKLYSHYFEGQDS